VTVAFIAPCTNILTYLLTFTANGHVVSLVRSRRGTITSEIWQCSLDDDVAPPPYPFAYTRQTERQAEIEPIDLTRKVRL